MMRSLNLSIPLKFEKMKLLERINANRTAHAKLVDEARKGYVEQATKALQSRLRDMSEGRIVNLDFHLRVPMDMTKAYDTIINMLMGCTDTEITLDPSEYRQLVMDEWDWSEQFFASNAPYTSRQ